MTRPIAVLVLLALACCCAAQNTPPNEVPTSEADNVEGATIADPRVTIFKYVQSATEHRVLSQLINQGDLRTELQRDFWSTFFAPTDNAFAALARRLLRDRVGVDGDNPRDVMIKLADGMAELARLGELPELQRVLKYHAVGSLNSYAKLEAQRDVRTMAGINLTFVDNIIMDKWPERNVSTSRRDVLLSNGWFNSVEAVLLPFDLTEAFQRLDGAPTQSPTASPTVTPSVGATAPTDPDGDDDGLTDVDGSTDGDDGDGTSTTGGVGGSDTDGGGEDDDDVTGSGDPDISSEDSDDGVCFPAAARLHVAGGATVAMRDLKSGAHAVHNEQGEASRVFLFTHRNHVRRARFVRVDTACGHSITLTPSHYLRLADDTLVAARVIVAGDMVRTVSGACAVVHTSIVSRVGLFAPHSLHGDLVVDGVVVSSYSSAVAPSVAHVLLAPLRWVAATTGMVDPVGRLFDNGADWALRFVPRGRDRY